MAETHCPTEKPVGGPRYYQSCFEGLASPGWEDWFGGLKQETVNGNTLLSGTLPDQCALLGVLDAIHNLGLTLIYVCCTVSHESEKGESENESD